MNPPTHAPSAAELLADAVVRAALDRAWSDSLPADPTARHEEGGWIYLDLTTGRLSTQRCLAVGTAGIDLSKPPTVYGSIVVGKFHTHPHPRSEGWDVGPSASDIYWDDIDGVPDLIRADDGVHLSGPDSRRGGL